MANQDELTQLLATLPPAKVSTVLATAVEWTQAGLSKAKVEQKTLELARLLSRRQTVTMRRLTGSEASKAAARFEGQVKRHLVDAIVKARKALPMRELEARLTAHPHDVPMDLLESVIKRLEVSLG